MMLITIEDEKFAEGRARGREEGRREAQREERHAIYERLVTRGMSPQEAADMTGWNVNSSYSMN